MPQYDNYAMVHDIAPVAAVTTSFRPVSGFDFCDSYIFFLHINVRRVFTTVRWSHTTINDIHIVYSRRCRYIEAHII